MPEPQRGSQSAEAVTQAGEGSALMTATARHAGTLLAQAVSARLRRLLPPSRQKPADLRGLQRLVPAYARFRARDGTANAVRVYALPDASQAPAPSCRRPGQPGLMSVIYLRLLPALHADGSASHLSV
jgi:hypothetical protein